MTRTMTPAEPSQKTDVTSHLIAFRRRVQRMHEPQFSRRVGASKAFPDDHVRPGAQAVKHHTLVPDLLFVCQPADLRARHE
jgi:hypothetical protein